MKSLVMKNFGDTVIFIIKNLSPYWKDFRV